MKKTDDISKVVVMSFCLLKIDTSLTKKNRLKHLTNHSKRGAGGEGGIQLVVKMVYNTPHQIGSRLLCL